MPKAKLPKTFNYGEKLDELEALLGRTQREELDVEEMMVLFQKGMTLVEQLETYLASAENTMRSLRETATRAIETPTESPE